MTSRMKNGLRGVLLSPLVLLLACASDATTGQQAVDSGVRDSSSSGKDSGSSKPDASHPDASHPADAGPGAPGTDAAADAHADAHKESGAKDAAPG